MPLFRGKNRFFLSITSKESKTQKKQTKKTKKTKKENKEGLGPSEVARKQKKTKN